VTEQAADLVERVVLQAAVTGKVLLDPAAFTTACALRAHTASVVLRDRDISPTSDPRHVERWCP